MKIIESNVSILEFIVLIMLLERWIWLTEKAFNSIVENALKNTQVMMNMNQIALFLMNR